MAGLLNSTGTPIAPIMSGAASNFGGSPQSQIMYGNGNTNISPDTIRAYINAPGRSASDILGAALSNNVSANQIEQAMSGNANFTPDAVNNYLSAQGINNSASANPYAQTPSGVSAGSPVKNTPITVGQQDTVQGQLNGILNNPNSPLMVQARTAGNEYANSRGLLNSSIGAGAAESAMINAATPIAQQDASTNFNAQVANSQQGLQAGMFNSDLNAKVGMFNNQLNSQIGMFNAGTNKDIQMNNQNLNNNMAIAQMDMANKYGIANVQAMANDSGVMGSNFNNYLTLYAQTMADPNMTPDVKTSNLNELSARIDAMFNLYPSVKNTGVNTTFQ